MSPSEICWSIHWNVYFSCWGRLCKVLKLALTASFKYVSSFVRIPNRIEMILMMLEKLRIKKQFIPCPVDSEDELFPNGIFIFNISKMTEFINANQPLFPKELVSIKDLDNWNEGTLNEEAVNCADLSRPIILAEISPKRLSLIDGHHRLEKANRLGAQTLPAFKISSKFHTQFLTTQKGYEAYIRYWNEKIKNLQNEVS